MASPLVDDGYPCYPTLHRVPSCCRCGGSGPSTSFAFVGVPSFFEPRDCEIADRSRICGRLRQGEGKEEANQKAPEGAVLRENHNQSVVDAWLLLP